MGTLLRAVFGFAIALAVYSPHAFATYLGTTRLTAVKAELAATHPKADLQAMIRDELKGVTADHAD